MKRSKKRNAKVLRAHRDALAKELKDSSDQEDIKSGLEDIIRLLDNLQREEKTNMKKSRKKDTDSEIFPPAKYDTVVSYPGKKKPSTTPIKTLHFPGEEIEDETQEAVHKTTEWLLKSENQFTLSGKDTQQREYEKLLPPLNGDNSASVSHKNENTSMRQGKPSGGAQKAKENDWKKCVKRIRKKLSKSPSHSPKLNISIASHKKMEDFRAIEISDEETPPVVESTGDEKDRRALQEVINQSRQEPNVNKQPPLQDLILKNTSTKNPIEKPENDPKIHNIVVNGGNVHLNTSDNTNIIFSSSAVNKFCDTVINVIFNKIMERFNITEKDRSIERDDLIENDDNNEVNLTDGKAVESADTAKRTTESVTVEVVNERLNLESDNLFTATENELLTPKLGVSFPKKVPRPLSARKRKLNQDDNDDDTVEDTPQKMITKKPTRSTSQSRSIRKSLDIPKISKDTPLKDMEDDIVMDEMDPSRSNVEIASPSKDVTPLNATRFSRRILESSTPYANLLKDVTPLDTTRFSRRILKSSTPNAMEAKKSLSFDKNSLGIFEHSQNSGDFIEATRKSETKKRPIIMTTHLLPEMTKLVEDWTRRFNWTFVHGLYKEEATHLVVGNMGNNRAPRTVKYLQFLVHHKWIVSFEWLKACADKNRYVNEEPYELLDDGGDTGPTKSRVTKKKLFSTYTFYLFEFDSPNYLMRIRKDQLTDILQSAGGKVVECPTEASAADKRLAIVDMDHDSPTEILEENETKYINLFTKHGFVAVSLEWVFFSLGSQEIISFDQSLMCPAYILPADCFALSQTCEGTSQKQYD